MSDEHHSRCRLCGGVHRSRGDECHPPVGRVIELMEQAEDERDELRAEVERLCSPTAIEPGDPICSVTCACCGAALEITHGDDPGEVSVVGCRRNLPWCDCTALERERDEALAELRRAHAAIHWYATVRTAITSGALKAHDEDAYRGFVNILAVAHAASEVWLAGDPTADPIRAIADLLGWHAPHAELAVREWLRPLQAGTYPPLVTEDGLPNINGGENG